jgi:medium-chain acyl-[acyl-carrier-protein] hydrolase
LREAPIAHLLSIAHEVAAQVRPLLDLPVAFFGHSMGAWVAFETARLLAADGLEPRILFVSGKSAPHLRDRRQGVDGLSDDAFLDAMDELYGGIPALFRTDPEFRSLYLPPLRADVATLLRHVHVESAPLTCELHALGGLGDTSLTREDLAAWRRHSTGEFATHFFPGNHFFVQSARTDVIALVSGRLARLDRDAAACR